MKLNKLLRFPRLLVAIIAIFVLTMSFAAPITTYAQTYPREESLVYGNIALPNNFNPFSWSAASETSFLYVPLFLYNPAKASILPFIAEGYEWINKTALKIKIRPEAKWSDGTPITTDDVLFAWNLSIKLGMSGGSELYYDLKKLNDKEFLVIVKKPNYAYLFSVLFMVPVPKHVFEKVYNEYVKENKSFATWPNNDFDKMVVSGPYKVKTYVPESVLILQRDDNWWGKSIFGLPRPKYIVVRYFKSVSVEILSFQKGELDVYFHCAVKLEDVLKSLPDAGSWYSGRPYVPFWSIWSLYINYKKYPLNDPVLRRAIAYVIPYDEIIEKALGYTSIRLPYMYALLGPQWKEYFNETIAKKYWGDQLMPVYDPEKARKILKEAGYYWDSNGILHTPNGTPVGTPDKPLIAEIPEGWEDSIISLKLIVENMKKELGIQVELRTVDASIWWNDLLTGQFDISESAPLYATCYPPWFTYKSVMDPREAKPIGTQSYYNRIRYVNPKVADILDMIASNFFNETIVKRGYSELQEIFMHDLPIIPIDYGQMWYAYRQVYWTNWPNEKNPYWGAFTVWAGGAYILPVLFAITPKGQTPSTPSWITDLQIPITKFYQDAAKAAMPTQTTTTQTTSAAPGGQVTVTTTVTKTTTATTTIYTETPVPTTVRETDWSIIAIVAIVLLIIGFAIGYLVKKR